MVHVVSEKNRRQGIPKGFPNRLVKEAFPEERPIFWAGNQRTEFPSSYVEPDPLKTQLMQIPVTLRFITGGRIVDAGIDRMFYLGWSEVKLWSHFRDFSVTACPACPLSDMPGGSRPDGYRRYVFNSEIVLDANMTSTQVIELKTQSVECNKDFATGATYDPVNLGGDQLNFRCLNHYTTGVFCAPTPTICDFYNFDSSFVDEGPTVVSSSSAATLAALDTDAESTPNVPTGSTNLEYRIHYFLRNIISGMTQTNILGYYVSANAALPDPSLITYADLNKVVFLTGLVVNP